MARQLNRVGVLGVEPRLSKDIARTLLQNGYLADTMQHVINGQDYCQHINPAALVLATNDATDDGANVIEQIRDTGFSNPIVVLADDISDQARIGLLSVGADDVLSKPWSSEELLQRLSFILDQHKNLPNPTNTDQVQNMFTPTEKRILEVLSRAAPEVVTRETIMWEVNKQKLAPEDRTLDVYISNIRRKIRLTGAKMTIKTVRGIGFTYEGTPMLKCA